MTTYNLLDWNLSKFAGYDGLGSGLGQHPISWVQQARRRSQEKLKSPAHPLSFGINHLSYTSFRLEITPPPSCPNHGDKCLILSASMNAQWITVLSGWTWRRNRTKQIRCGVSVTMGWREMRMKTIRRNTEVESRVTRQPCVFSGDMGELFHFSKGWRANKNRTRSPIMDVRRRTRDERSVRDGARFPQVALMEVKLGCF